MDILRAACPALNDADILDLVVAADADWYAGYSLGDEYVINDDVCEGRTIGCAYCLDTIAEFVYLVLHTTAPPTPLPPVLVQSILVGHDGQFLGNVNDNAFDADSLANSFGTYGSTFNSLSIWNQFGTYGSEFNSLSPWNEFSTTPPCVVENGSCVLFVTANVSIRPSIHPNDLAIAVGRTDVVR